MILNFATIMLGLECGTIRSMAILTKVLVAKEKNVCADKITSVQSHHVKRAKVTVMMIQSARAHLFVDSWFVQTRLSLIVAHNSAAQCPDPYRFARSHILNSLKLC